MATTKKPVFKTHHTHLDVQAKGEKIDTRSMTVPGQAISIEEMVKRYASGQSLPQMVQGMYYGEEEMPDFAKLDLSEIHDLKKRTEERIADYRKRLQDYDKKRQLEKYQEDVKAAAEKLTAQQAKPEAQAGQ